MRVIALAAWYTDGRTWRFDVANDDEFMAAWSSLPDDGALAFKVWYDQLAPVRLARNISGDEWYYARPTPLGLMLDHGSNSPKAEILARYPGAVVLRGMATSEDEMWRVSFEQAHATYWGDPPPVKLDGCCGD